MRFQQVPIWSRNDSGTGAVWDGSCMVSLRKVGTEPRARGYCSIARGGVFGTRGGKNGNGRRWRRSSGLPGSRWRGPLEGTLSGRLLARKLGHAKVRVLGINVLENLVDQRGEARRFGPHFFVGQDDDSHFGFRVEDTRAVVAGEVAVLEDLPPAGR